MEDMRTTTADPAGADTLRDAAARLTTELFDTIHPEREIHIAVDEDPHDAVRAWAGDLEKRILDWIDQHASLIERGVLI